MRPTIACGTSRIPAVLTLIGCALAIATGLVQSLAAADPPHFEVASIKPCKSTDLPARGQGRSGGPDGPGRIVWSPERLVAECVTADRLIRDAYLAYADGKPWPVEYGAPQLPIPEKVLEQDIKGSPAWLDSDHYTIEATAEGAPSREMMRGPMLRTLLEDRFKLSISRETRETPVYELRVAKGGPKLQVADGTCITFDRDHPPPMPFPGPPFPKVCGRWGGDTVYGTTMANLCDQIVGFSDRDVIDKTGITGRFDVHFELSGANLPPGDGDALFTAIRSALPRLGLMLVPATAPGEFLVIDHIEKPSEN